MLPSQPIKELQPVDSMGNAMRGGAGSSDGVFGLPALPGGMAAQPRYPAATAHNFAVTAEGSGAQHNGVTVFQADGHGDPVAALSAQPQQQPACAALGNELSQQAGGLAGASMLDHLPYGADGTGADVLGEKRGAAAGVDDPADLKRARSNVNGASEGAPGAMGQPSGAEGGGGLSNGLSAMMGGGPFGEGFTGMVGSGTGQFVVGSQGGLNDAAERHRLLEQRRREKLAER
jgi:hypothetical protein